MLKVVTLLGLALCAQGEPRATSQQMVKKEFVRHGELNHIGSHVPEHHEEYAWAYPSYEFSYSVNDPHTHDIKGQHEHRHGDEVKGEYWLLQPDGKKRTVKYQSDKHKGFKADVHYSELHEHHHHAEPHIEKIVKPVIEVIEEEPQKVVEEREPIVVEEAPVVVVEERSEEHSKPIHHNPLHVEYYINHKYRKHHHEEYKEHHQAERAEPEAERRENEAREEEPVGETGQEARIRENEAFGKEIKHHRPVHIEYYSQIHHPIHNEHHGHELPKHVVIHHELQQNHREEKRGREERQRIKENRDREEQRRREEQRNREENRVREEQRSREAKRIREEQRSREEKRIREEQRSREEKRERNEYHSHIEHRREHHEHEERFPLPPVFHPLNVGYHHADREEEYREPELHKHEIDEIRAEKKHDPHVQLLRLHKPVMFRPEHDHGYHRDHRRQRKTQ